MNLNTIAPAGAESGWQEAAYVTWLLRINPDKPFPFGPECTDEANQHLVDWVLGQLHILSNGVDGVAANTSEFRAYRRTILHCNAVMNGTNTIPPPDTEWDCDERCYRRGLYQPEGQWSGSDGQ